MIALAFALALAAPDPQHSSEAPPSAAALGLARQIGPSGLWWLHSQDSVEEFAAMATQRLLSTQLAWRGVGCEPKDPECRATAEKLAREAAPGMLASRREAAMRFMAHVIDDQMTPEQIAAAQAAARSPGGQGLLKLLTGLADPGQISPAAQTRLQRIMLADAPRIERDLGDRFFDATKHLPRAISFAPPPPITPTRPRNTQ